MATDPWKSPADLFDEAAGIISPSIFADRDIYKLELERVFSKSWLFIAHETHIPKTGDYFATHMAEDPVVAVRQKDGSVRVFMNQCRHRGMKICRTDGGNAKAFTCTYHGWAYDIGGDLVSVPLEEKSFVGLDKSQWGARQARVESYKGLIFATWNMEAPCLSDYLGDAAFYLDAVLDRSAAGTEVIGGITKWVIPCNWKLAAEQFCSDMYHGLFSHGSIFTAASIPPSSLNTGRQFRAARGGHGTGFFVRSVPEMKITNAGERVAGYDPVADEKAAVARLGTRGGLFVQHMTIFPSFSFFAGFNSLRVWHPRGPDKVEVWAFTIVEKDASAATKEQLRISSTRTFSPAGTWEQDDGENWVEIQRVLRGHEARRTSFNIQMGMGRDYGTDPDLPGSKRQALSEDAARGFYAHWLTLMTQPDKAYAKGGNPLQAAE
ncbi:MAG: aromatic ring-hydroxylating dioxygenase subunit alpha [Parvibaculum sp.]|nr:aromatic ring-hydroxylating dioxygenase subunit alpha [Parvibaculum sp.]